MVETQLSDGKSVDPWSEALGFLTPVPASSELAGQSGELAQSKGVT